MGNIKFSDCCNMVVVVSMSRLPVCGLYYNIVPRPPVYKYAVSQCNLYFLFRHRLLLLKVCVLSSFVVRLLHRKTTTWCQEWLQICELLIATVSSANQADC